MESERSELKDGAFLDSLKRNNKQIKADRAEAIGEDAEMSYRRTVEDLVISLKRLQRQQDNMLDMSPDNTLSLTLASNFDAQEYTDKDLELGIEIRNTEVKLEIAEKRFAYLFGGM